MRDLAEKLLAIEEAANLEGHTQSHEATKVYEKLRTQLTRLAGVDGFAALMRRALALARAQVPALQHVQVKADGSIENLEDALGDHRESGHEASIQLISNFLILLVTFIGEPLTIRMVKDAWPDQHWNT